MPTVVWTLGANSLTFDQGIVRGPHSFDMSGVVSARLAGGAMATYDLGISDVEVLDCVFPNISRAKLDAATSWKDTVAKKALNPFTHTDNSESPAVVKTVRLISFEARPEMYGNPSSPLFRIRATLQVEPA